jgi:two-component system cell cycle response regulator
MLDYYDPGVPSSTAVPQANVKRSPLRGSYVGPNDVNESFGAFEAQTARYDAGWLQGIQLDKKLPTLLVLRGADAGLRIPLTKDTLTLGRTVDSDLVFHDDQISRRHATISFDSESGKYYLADLGSTNGTFLNDRPVTKTELNDGDKIFAGTTILKFVLQDEVESESGEIVDRLMFQDDLTGLMVKRRFFNELKIQLNYSGVQGHSLSLFMMDLDGLKKVNDTHGHSTGAYVIAEAGKIIGAICNNGGQACRYGGDEFIAYSLRLSKSAALELAESVRKAIKEHLFEKDGVQLSLSISIGVATFPEDGKSLEGVSKAADEALYRAKARGRDAVSD